MLHRLARVVALAVALTGASLQAAQAQTERQTENIVSEQRISVAVRIKPEAARAFLPAGWEAAGANGPTLSVIFMDRALQLMPDGQPMNAGFNRVLVLVMGGRNAETGETRSFVVGGYSADPAGAPGAYKVYKPGAVSVNRSEQRGYKDGKLQTLIEEHWSAVGADGASLKLDIAYERGVPKLQPMTQKVHSAAEPNFYRIYRGQIASETLRSETGAGKVSSFSLKAKGGPLGAAIDGTETILSISSAPIYSRQTFVPE